jgi:Resolvase, N terminal domain
VFSTSTPFHEQIARVGIISTGPGLSSPSTEREQCARRWPRINSLRRRRDFAIMLRIDKRPIFQQKIERACGGENAFDVIAVHSYSRIFRDAFGQEFYLRKLAKQGVKLVSITQPLGDDDDPAQAMKRKVITLFDEYQSKENANMFCVI